ncbi:hypothetical protein ES702_07401 [subsurface metagenome]
MPEEKKQVCPLLGKECREEWCTWWTKIIKDPTNISNKPDKVAGLCAIIGICNNTAIIGALINEMKAKRGVW